MIRRLVVLTAFCALALHAQDLQQTFKIQPLHPIPELRAAALKAQPPAESGNFRQADLVELVKIDPTIKLDIHYASTNNFLGTPVYTQARAFLERPAAESLVRANRKLHEQGYGVLIFDGYRPWYVTKIFWDATPPEDHDYVADPSQGSRHNRGCAVDLTLYDLKTGKPLDMPSGYDEMTERAHPDYTGGTVQERANRELLRHAMEAEGFTVYTTEWWHFDYKDWPQYPIVNIPFEDLNTAQSSGAAFGDAGLVADKIHSEWSAAMHAKNLEGVVALYTEDGEFIQPTGERVVGRAAIREMTKGIFATFTSDLAFHSDRVEQAGDLLFDTGEFQETLIANTDGSKMESRGSYLMVLKRRADGWEIAEQVWTGVMPCPK
jgi:zinc D-Ala-D-Ala dipeptidase